jgi:hypothetical protein
VPPPPTPISTYLQFSTSVTHNPEQQLSQFTEYNEMPDFLTQIPGMSFTTPQPGWMQCSGYGSDFMPAPVPMQLYAQPLATSVVPVAHLQHQADVMSHSAYIPATPSTLAQPSYSAPTPSTLADSPPEHGHGLAIRTAPHTIMHAAIQHPTFSSNSNGVFRPSCYELEPGFAQATSGGWLPETRVFKE